MACNFTVKNDLLFAVWGGVVPDDIKWAPRGGVGWGGRAEGPARVEEAQPGAARPRGLLRQRFVRRQRLHLCCRPRGGLVVFRLVGRREAAAGRLGLPERRAECPLCMRCK